MRYLPLCHLALATAVVSACGGGSTPVPPGAQVTSSLSREAPAPASSPDVAQASTDNVGFTVDLYQSTVGAESGNGFFSPWSVSLALAMTYAGASGDTATQTATAMHFTLPGDRLHAAFNTLDQTMQSDAAHPSSGSPVELRIANALFAQTGHAFLSPFIDTLGEYYGAGVSLLDFVNAPDASRVQINSWVSAMTDGHIPTLLAPGFITPDTTLVLTNAIYFDGAWQTTFDTSDTRATPFHRAAGDDVSVQMMNVTETARFASGSGWQALELPYANQDTTMLVVMPTLGTLGSFEAGFSAAQLASIVGALGTQQVAVGLPKFTMRSSFDLVPVLTAMGMSQPFIPYVANFSAMDGMMDLYISAIVHQAWVDVSEAGTQAAAATAVGISGASAVEEPTPVVVDHPFMVFIRDNPTGTVLFAGRVADPTAM